MCKFSVNKLNAFVLYVEKAVLFKTGKIHGVAFMYENIK